MSAFESSPDTLLNPFLAALDPLSSRRVLLFSGKGGVGKTTVSALAALHFSRTRKVILFTTDPASNLGDLFPDGESENLRLVAVEATKLYQQFLDENLEQFLELGDRGTFLEREEMRRFFELALPGVDELMAWLHIGDLATANRDALLIVDTAPTGHALRMLAAQMHFQHLGEALEAMQEKHRGMIRQFMRREVRDALDAFLETFRGRMDSHRALLTDPGVTGLIPVTLAEEWVVEQTERLMAEVEGQGIDIPFVVINRTSVCDCRLCAGRREREERAQSAFRPQKTVNIPRSCVPLDTRNHLQQFLSGTLPVAPAPVVSGPAATQPLTMGQAKMLFLAGKGGVGKTSSAASIALQLAERFPEKHFTIISVDPAHSLRDVFAHEPPPANLTVETIDTRAKWERFRENLGDEIRRALDALTPGHMTLTYDAATMEKLVDIAPPGADELFAITRLSDLAADETQAMVIVDTAPIGHFLRLLELPNTAGEWVREFMRILLHYRELVAPGALGAELVQASRSLTALDQFLRSDRASVVLVTRPERVVVAETRRLSDELVRRGVHIGGLIANYVTPANDCPCDRIARSYEMANLASLHGEPVIVERRDLPVTKLAEIEKLVPLQA